MLVAWRVGAGVARCGGLVEVAGDLTRLGRGQGDAEQAVEDGAERRVARPLVLGAVAWALLFLDAWRIGQPLSYSMAHRRVSVGVNGLLALGVAAVTANHAAYAWSLYRRGARNDALGWGLRAAAWGAGVAATRSQPTSAAVAVGGAAVLATSALAGDPSSRARDLLTDLGYGPEGDA